MLIFGGKTGLPIRIIWATSRSLAGVPAKKTATGLRVYMQVGVNVARMHDRALRIDRILSRPMPQDVIFGSDRHDRVALHGNSAAINNGAARIHREHAAVLDDEITGLRGRHCPNSSMSGRFSRLVPSFKNCHVNFDAETRAFRWVGKTAFNTQRRL